MDQGKIQVMAAGYSGRSLPDKLGFKSGFSCRVINPPSNYHQLLGDLPACVKFQTSEADRKDLIHLFSKLIAEIEKQIPLLKKEIVQDGMIWVSWPKKASGIKTDITEDRIRECAIFNGLVDVKVCAIDETWSGLKLVIPVKNRKPGK